MILLWNLFAFHAFLKSKLHAGIYEIDGVVRTGLFYEITGKEMTVSKEKKCVDVVGILKQKIDLLPNFQACPRGTFPDCSCAGVVQGIFFSITPEKVAVHLKCYLV